MLKSTVIYLRLRVVLRARLLVERVLRFAAGLAAAFSVIELDLAGADAAALARAKRSLTTAFTRTKLLSGAKRSA